MSNTTRRSKLDASHGCVEGYIERKKRSSLCFIDPERRDFYLDWDKTYWSRRNRDGKSGDYHRGGGKSRKFYRSLTNKLIRNQTRNQIAKCRRDDDWDDAIYPTQWDGKKFIWSVW